MSSLGSFLAAPTDSLRESSTTYRRVLDLAGGRVVKNVMRGHDCGSIAVFLYASPPYDLRLPPLSVPRLSINLTASRVTGGVDGERGRTFVTKRHSLFLTPEGVPTRWRKSSPSRHLNVYFRPPATSDHGRDELVGQLQQAGPVFSLVLPGSGALIDQLAFELSEDGPFVIEAVDSLALLLLVQLGRRRLGSNGAGLMTAQRMARLDEYVAANLGERILVADLAAIAGVPVGPFAQAFTRYSGRSPHQYVLSRRVERATAMLRRGQDSLAEVAAACGFASQQHMSRVLRIRLGMTPAAVRGASSAPPGDGTSRVGGASDPRMTRNSPDVSQPG